MKATKNGIGIAAFAALIGAAQGQTVPPGTYGGTAKVNVEQARIEAQTFRSGATDAVLSRWLGRARRGATGTLTLRPDGTYTWRIQDGNQIVEDQEGRWRGKPTSVRTMRRFARPAVQVMLWPLHGYAVYDVGSRKPKSFPMGGAMDEWTMLYESSFKYMDYAAETTGTVTMRLSRK